MPALALVGFLTSSSRRRRAFLSPRVAERPGTWDCGYAEPTPRMQYGSSLGAGISGFLPRFPRARLHGAAPRGVFPATAPFETIGPDPFGAALYNRSSVVGPPVRTPPPAPERPLTLYLVYIFLTTVVTLVWSVLRPHV